MRAGGRLVPAMMTIDVRGETCPVPLIEARRALQRASYGEDVEILGDHDSSWKEIPLLARNLGAILLAQEGGPEGWRFVLRRGT